MSASELETIIESAVEKAMATRAGKELPNYLTKTEAARLLRISIITLQKLIDKGEIKAENFGNAQRIPLDEVTGKSAAGLKYKREGEQR